MLHPALFLVPVLLVVPMLLVPMALGLPLRVPALPAPLLAQLLMRA